MSEVGAPPKPIRILLVEDDVDHALLAQRGLDEEAFDVTHVRTGADALEAARQHDFDVCLIDQRLPDREGVEVCRTLRGEGLDGLIFLVTSATRDALADEAFQAGADDYIVKGPSFMGRIAEDVRAELGV